MRIFKDSLPAGLSYALKPSILEAELRSAAVETETSLFQWRSGWSRDGILFRADFCPPGTYGQNADERLHVTSRALPSRLRAQAMQFVGASVLPEFIAWVSHIESLERASTVRRETQWFERAWLPMPKGG